MFKKGILLKNQEKVFFLILIYFFIQYLDIFRKIIEINNSGGDMFLSADWLINYNFGFVRRGFPGTLFINNFLDLNQSLFLLSTLQITIYILIFYLFYKIFIRINQDLVSFVFILSPVFFLSFPINDFRGGFRKELFGYLTILTLINSLQKNRSLLFFHILFFFSIFASEMNLLFLPFIFYLFQKYDVLNKSRHFTLIFLTSFSYIITYFVTKKNYSKIQFEICNDLIIRGYPKEICNGSVNFISSSTFEYFNVSNNFYSSVYLKYYAFVVIMSLIPFFLIKVGKNKILFYFFNFIYFIPFMVISMDWGRFLSIHFSIIYLSIMLIEQKGNQNIYKVFLLIVINFFWKVQHCCVGFYEIDSALWELLNRAKIFS